MAGGGGEGLRRALAGTTSEVGIPCSSFLAFLLFRKFHGLVSRAGYAKKRHGPNV